MGMKIGCCACMEDYDLLVDVGYDTITLPARDIAMLKKEAFHEVQVQMESGPLQFYGFNAFCYPELKMNGKFFCLQKVVNYTKPLLERAAALKAQYIAIGGPLSRNVLPDEKYEKSMEQFRSSIEAICQLAQPYGIDILLESVTAVEGNFLTTVREAYGVLKKWKQPNLHLVYDIYHEQTESQPLKVIEKIGKEIRTVHLAQNIANKRHYLDLLPQHLLSYRAYLSSLKEIGYVGEVSIESMVGDCAVGIAQSYPIVKEILEQLGG